jgi:endonuclease/exonuclease/phosphatase (EEP) superfamily protein YafD
MMISTRILGPALAVLLSGCLSIPSTEHALRADSADVRSTPSRLCEATRTPGGPAANEGGLDPGRFRVLTWNVHKGDGSGWLTDLAWFGAHHDLVLMQEVRLSPRLRRVLREEGLHWALAEAFRFDDAETGVLTAARARVNFACMLRATEPVTRIPKAVVVTRVPFAGSSTSLLVANVHALNFTLGTEDLRAQLDAVAAILDRYEGPVIFAGDFNTWSTARRRAVDAIVRRLGLRAVSFAADERSRFFGEPVDWMYYRGLIAGAARAVPVESSDHNPVSVVFRLDEANRQRSGA